MEAIAIIIGLVMLFLVWKASRTESESLKGFRKHPKLISAAAILLILAGLIGLIPAPQEAAGERAAKTGHSAPQSESLEPAEQEDPYKGSVFSKEVVDAIVDKLSPLAEKGYRAKVRTYRGTGEYSKNFSYKALIAKDGKTLASIIYKSTFYFGDMARPPEIRLRLFCMQDRGLLSGCADPQTDPDGFLVIRSLWDVMGLEEEDLSKVLTAISSAYRNPNEYRSIKFPVTGANGMEYMLVIDFSFKLEREGNKIVAKPIIEDMIFHLFEEEDYHKAYGS